MPEKRVYYDCQVCGKLHSLVVKWTLDELRARNFRKGEMEVEMQEAFMDQCKRSFSDLHPGEKFEPSRVEEK